MVAWVEVGMAGEMHWFTASRARSACRPRDRFPWARSIIALAMPYYRSPGPGQTPFGWGKISRYAIGPDYHPIVKDRLAKFAALLRAQEPAIQVFPYVDTAPIAERAIAVRAGLGWFGKNANLLTARHGSWVFLAGLITNIELAPDVPLRKSCGSCTRCLQACPTGALVAPYVVDSRRCISYLTIEHRGAIPEPLRPLLGDLVFGCDICQEVCPVNAVAAASPRPAGEPPARPYDVLADGPNEPDLPAAIQLASILSLDDDAFHVRFEHSALRRTKRLGLQRNAIVALGNAGNLAAAPALITALHSADDLLREHAAWALARLADATGSAV